MAHGFCLNLSVRMVGLSFAGGGDRQQGVFGNLMTFLMAWEHNLTHLTVSQFRHASTLGVCFSRDNAVSREMGAVGQ